MGYRGWSLPPSLDWHATRTVYGTELDRPRKADVLTGTWGILVQPRFFDDRFRDYGRYPSEAFFVDDVWTSGHLARRGVPRLIVPCIRPPMSTRLTRVNGLFGANNGDGRNNNVVIQAFAQFWARQCRCSTTSRNYRDSRELRRNILFVPAPASLPRAKNGVAMRRIMTKVATRIVGLLLGSAVGVLLFWYVARGIDFAQLVAHSVRKSGSATLAWHCYWAAACCGFRQANGCCFSQRPTDGLPAVCIESWR